MSYPLTVAIVVASAALMLLALGYAVRDRLLDDLMLAVAALTEVGTVIALVIGLAHLGQVRDDTEVATFAAYLISVPLILLVTVWIALKEKTRWAMASVAVGAFAVLVMTARIQQIWDLRA